MNSSNRSAIVLGSLIVLMLAIGGFMVMRNSSDPADGTDVTQQPSASPSEVSTDATSGGANGGAGATPSPSPSEVGGDATTGGANGGGLPTEPSGGEGGDDEGSEDPSVGGGDDGETGDGAGGDGDTDDGAGGDGDTDDGDDDAGEGDRDVAGDFEADTTDAGKDGDLPETGVAAVLPGLMLLGAGLCLRPRR